MNDLKLKFFGINLKVKTNWVEFRDLLSKDFSCFLEEFKKSNFSIEIFNESPQSQIIPPLRAHSQSLQCVIYREGNLSYFDYDRVALLIFDSNKKSAKLYSQDINRAHELFLERVAGRLSVNTCDPPIGRMIKALAFPPLRVLTDQVVGHLAATRVGASYAVALEKESGGVVSPCCKELHMLGVQLAAGRADTLKVRPELALPVMDNTPFQGRFFCK